jgi:hypothetical protein
MLTLALRHLNDDHIPSLLLVEPDSTDLDPLKLQASTVDGGLNPPLFGAGCLPVRFCQCWPLVGRGTSTEVGDAELKLAFPLSMLLSC